MMEETDPQLDSSHYQMKLHCQEWVTLNKMLAKGPHGKTQTTPTIAKGIGSSPQTDDKALLKKTVPIQLTEHGKIKLMPT